MSELGDRYFRTLHVDPGALPTERRLEAALARAYEQRSFEIEHYWKRAAYFWGFEIAIFAAFGLILSKEQTTLHPVSLILAGLGFLTALANSFSARGSKFWQENWERHIDMLENLIEGRLYKTVWLKDGKVSFSVSKVNAALSDCFAGFWFIITCYVGWKFIGAPLRCWPDCVTFARIYVCLVALLVSVREHIESCESFMIQERWPDSRRVTRCGRQRTAHATTAADCATQAI